MHQKLTRTLLSAIAIAAATTGFAQQNDTLRRKDPNGWEFIQVRAYNVVRLEGYLHNGIKEGVWSDFHPMGFPSGTTSYLHGKKNGMAMKITGAGMVEALENYKDDKLEGPVRVYNPEGMGLLEESYYSDGKKHGNFTKWYKNGRKQETGVFSNDIRQGKSTWYFENGSMAAEYNYTDGQIEGDAATYYPNGKVSASGKYNKGLETGLWKEYYENGNLKAEGNYVNGEKEGIWKNYDENGKFTKNSKYVKGELK